MPKSLKLDLASLAKAPTAAAGETLIAFVGPDFAYGETTRAALQPAHEHIARAAAAAKFKPGRDKLLDILAPAGLTCDRLILVGVGEDGPEANWTKTGGIVAGKLGRGKSAVALFDPPAALEDAPAAAADFALGLRLRDYRFDRYKTKKPDEDKDADAATHVRLAVADLTAAKKAAKSRDAIVGGVLLARDLVNEPANVLSPVVFAEHARKLEKLGVEVEILDEKALRKIGMRALLGVGQGSENESRVAIMRWRGTKGQDKPLAIVGKGVCFDSGGISIKPAAGMEGMKGDMAGAACVLGLMHTLATRKAKVDVIGAIGLVENMPSGAAQRPGDIVTSLSGQTIEIINTDAEGRLVLADVLWHIRKTYDPAFIVDLATLTGAIMVALGNEHAGLFSNNDELAARIDAAGRKTGETVWRMPLGKAYDKLIDSKFADMKNTGGPHGGSITAAQFLQRYVDGAPWAHLDIAGTGMNAPSSDINESWGSGWGVRLLDRLIADHYEG